MMTEPKPATRSGVSTASIVFAVVALVLDLISYSSGSGIAALLGIMSAVAGLVLGIVAKRESSITISAVSLLFGLAVGFGVIG